MGKLLSEEEPRSVDHSDQLEEEWLKYYDHLER